MKDVHPERVLERSLLEAPADLELPSPEACSSSKEESLCAQKRPGRLQTRPTFNIDGNYVDEGWAQSENNATTGSHRRRLLQSRNVASLLNAEELWNQGHRGGGVRMGVFDTGIKANHPDVKNIKERTNWTHEPTLEDGLGHGSFVAGVIAGTSPSCPGLAPEVEIHTFRVFTNDQVSYTSWFLDAFNYAIATEMDVVNLSIGGPDHLDEPFVEKVGEVTSAGIIMVSAIGNDGPLYGTLNNPADQNDVIGVGGIDWDGHIAAFSSRGMSTWELPTGYGRSKPDIMAFGKEVQGSRIDGGCRSLSGTSVASPVVAGAVCLVASTMPSDRRAMLNPASMKQALVEGAALLPGLNMFEQGQGKLDVLGAAKVLSTYTPRASIVPAALNLTQCPYAWPFCRQQLYAGAMSLMFNATILNGMGVVGELEGEPTWEPEDEGGRLLDVRFEWPDQLWPWSGHLGLFLRVKPSGVKFSGVANGVVTFTVVSPPALGEKTPRRSIVTWHVSAEIIPTPPRGKRILWDQFHSIRYPPAYFPRDDLTVRHDILDWHGDHPHTNFHAMYDALRDAGYYLEILASPATCFDAENYGALMIVDSEDEFYPDEVAKLVEDVRSRGLGLLVFADWYDVENVKKMRFYDDNTRSWWEAATGGANIPALNDLIAPLGAAFAGGVHDVQIEIPGAGNAFRMASGSSILALPAGAYIHNITESKTRKGGEVMTRTLPVLGLSDIGAGRLVLYGDSNCLDSSHQQSNCHTLLMKLLAYAAEKDDTAAAELLPPNAQLEEPFGSLDKLPVRRPDYNFTAASFVLQHDLTCYANAPLQHQGLEYQGDEAVATHSKEQKKEGAGKEISTAAEEGGGKGLDDANTGPVSRDIAAEQEQQRNQAEEKKSVSGGSEKSNATAGDSLKGSEDGSSGSVEKSADAQDKLLPPALPTRKSWSRLPANVVQLSQTFTVIGGIGLVVLWSLVGRRRSGTGSPSQGANGNRRSTLLPLFWRTSSRDEGRNR